MLGGEWATEMGDRNREETAPLLPLTLTSLGTREGGAAAKGRASPPHLHRPGESALPVPTSLTLVIAICLSIPAANGCSTTLPLSLGVPGAKLNIPILKSEKLRLPWFQVPGEPLDHVSCSPQCPGAQDAEGVHRWADLRGHAI